MGKKIKTLIFSREIWKNYFVRGRLPNVKLKEKETTAPPSGKHPSFGHLEVRSHRLHNCSLAGEFADSYGGPTLMSHQWWRSEGRCQQVTRLLASNYWSPFNGDVKTVSTFGMCQINGLIDEWMRENLDLKYLPEGPLAKGLVTSLWWYLEVFRA